MHVHRVARSLPALDLDPIVMPLLPNVQRLVARGPGSLADHLVVDVSAILRWIYETQADASRVWPLLDEAVGRSRRQVLWVVAPCVPACDGVEGADLEHEMQRLLEQHGLMAVHRTAQPLLASIREYLTIPHPIGVITAGLDDRLYQLLPLDQMVGQMLDIGSGKLWTYPFVQKQGLEPLAQPALRAIVGAEPGDKGTTRDARRYEAQLQEFVLDQKKFDETKVSPWLRNMMQKEMVRLDRRAEELRGGAERDTTTIACLTDWVQATTTAPRSTYVMPFFDDDGKLVVMRALARGQSFLAYGDNLDGCLRDLHAADAERWFVPHGLDLCAWMAERGLPLPRSVVDPAMAYFVLAPDHRLELAHFCPAARGYPADLREWLMDIERLESTPESIFHALDLLPQIDAELTTLFGDDGHKVLRPVFEGDVALTIPVLARIEQRGAWVDLPRGYSSWGAVEKKLLHRLRFHEKRLRADLAAIDPYNQSTRFMVHQIMEKLSMMIAWYWPEDVRPDQMLDRFVLAGLPAARAIERVRSIDTSGLEWVKKLAASGGRLRGRFVPQVTGRFGYRRHDLQNIPKHNIEGQLIRSALRGPPGYILFSVDYDSFEGRLLAAISGDPALLASAQQRDMHAANARLLFGMVTPELRGRVKNALYAIGYGQQKKGFICAQADLTNDEAASCFDAVVRGFPELMRYRERIASSFKATGIATSVGGWRRMPGNAREAINTGVQALAATIFRRVLRQLDEKLVPLGAFVLVQIHDEVLVAAPPESAQAARQIVTFTMEHAALDAPTLLPHPVPLFTKLHQGETWADL